MDKIIKIVRTFFWIEITQKRKIEKEAKKLKITESALVRHIINNWFKK